LGVSLNSLNKNWGKERRRKRSFSSWRWRESC